MNKSDDGPPHQKKRDWNYLRQFSETSENIHSNFGNKAPVMRLSQTAGAHGAPRRCSEKTLWLRGNLTYQPFGTAVFSAVGLSRPTAKGPGPFQQMLLTQLHIADLNVFARTLCRSQAPAVDGPGLERSTTLPCRRCCLFACQPRPALDLVARRGSLWGLYFTLIFCLPCLLRCKHLSFQRRAHPLRHAYKHPTPAASASRRSRGTRRAPNATTII